MRFVEAKPSDIDTCASFIKDHNVDEQKMRYVPSQVNEIRDKLAKRLASNHKVYTVYDASLEGVIELLIEEDERYIQLLSLFIKNDIRTVLDGFFKVMDKEYPSFEIDVVLASHNKAYIKYFRERQAKTDGFETMFKIEKEDMQVPINEEVTFLQKESYKDFQALHDRLYPDVYWTGKRLLKEDAPFRIIVKTKEYKLLGYCVLSMRGNKQEELYFVYADKLEDKETLVVQALSLGFQEKEELLVLLANHEQNDLPMYQALGFKEREKIITFSL